VDSATLYRAGKLDEAIEAANAALRSDPTSVSKRTLLFELLLFAGAFERAEKQLDVIARTGADAEMGAWLYRSALHSERLRHEMFETDSLPAGGVDPLPPAGRLNGRPFETVADADPRIGARLEIFAAGQYTWLPLAQVESVTAEAPTRLRDLMWIPAKVKVAPDYTGMDLGEVLIPAHAPGSAKHEDDLVRLGRVTDWVDLGEKGFAPIGQKLLLVDGEEFPLLELRELQIGAQAASDS
jgi:type VI secretion system protein ImpE